MQCIVPNCENDSSQISQGITYHIFPKEPLLRAAWLTALNTAAWEPEENSTVCSEHFLEDDLLVSSTGFRVLRAGAVPVLDVRVCRICFVTDCKLYSMTAHRTLSKAYESLTGLVFDNKDNIPPYLCSECIHRLQNCVRFRNTSLQAHLLLLEIIKNHGCVTLKLIQTAKDRCSTQSDCDLDIEFTETVNMCTDGEADKKPSPDFVDVSVISIKVENYDDINRDMTDTLSSSSEHTAVDGVKVENDDVLKQDILKAENSTNDDMIYMSSKNIKVEFDCVKDQESDSAISNIKLEDEYVGEDYMLDVSRPLTKLKHKSKLNTTAVQQATKISTHSSQTKVNIRRSPGLVSNTMSCDICPYRTDNKRQLLSHSKRHAAPMIFSCEMCSYVTDSKQNLKYHVNVHSDEKLYLCDFCGKRFTVKSNLTLHLRIHSGEKPYSCNICNKSFNQRGNLTTHLRAHSGKRPYSCEICKKRFNRKHVLTNHLTIHSDEKSYSCNICTKAFTLKTNLARHLKIHFGKQTMSDETKVIHRKPKLITPLRRQSDEKPYSCNVCNKIFNRKDYLSTHLRIHTGKKPHSCNICDKRFYRKTYLNTHLRVHSGNKPYSCEICNKAFNRKPNLARHMKTHSGK